MIDAAEWLEHGRDLRLETERLVLRRFGEGDLEVALEHELDERIMRWVRDPLPRPEVEEKVARFLGPWQGGEGEWLGLPFERRDQEGMIGLAAFRLVSAENQTVEIGYRLHPDHRRRGFTLEACRRVLSFLFDVARVRKVIAYCVVENEASYRLMEKLGMRREGQLREFSQLGGAWRDELVYGLLARERS